MKEYNYKIIINNESKNPGILYSFGSTKNISISVDRQKATIRFKLGVRKTEEEFLTLKSKLFRDAYRKALLVHAVKFSKGLAVKRIIVFIDDERTEVDAENDPIGYFPYMFSMIGNSNLDLNKSWNCLEEYIINTSKTKSDDDFRFAAACSFLTSKEHTYEIDRFSCLWTAMNAYYNYVSKRFEESLMKKYGLPSLPKGLTLYGKDADSMGAVIWLLSHKYPKMGDEETANRVRSLWKNNYVVEKELKDFSMEDIKFLYKSSYACLQGEPLPDRFEVLQKRAEEFEVDLFPFMLIEYPYNWRCRYMHGNRSTAIVLAYNDYEMGVLRTVNYFLDSFLNIEIPRMFTDDFWTEKEIEDVLNYMRHIRMVGEKDKYQSLLEKYITRSQKE